MRGQRRVISAPAMHVARCMRESAISGRVRGGTLSENFWGAEMAHGGGCDNGVAAGVTRRVQASAPGSAEERTNGIARWVPYVIL